MSDIARSVPHFWAKKEAEDYVERQGVPFVALRPGTYLGGNTGDYMASSLKKGTVLPMTPPGVRLTYIHPDDVARALAMAVDEPRALNKRIDLGSDRALSSEELAEVFARLLGTPVKTGSRAMMKIFPLFAWISSRLRDFKAMFDFFATGKMVADTTLQAQLFGPVPTAEETCRKMLREKGMSVTG